MRTLFTAFNGNNNSSSILLDLINCSNKLYLKNSLDTSIKQLTNKIRNNNYDLIVSFAQDKLDKNRIIIEKIDIENYNNYDIEDIKISLGKKYKVDYMAYKDEDLCFNLYKSTINYILKNGLKTKMIFIRIPKLENIDVNVLAKDISAIDSIFYK